MTSITDLWKASGRTTGSLYTNNAAMRYFDIFQQSIEEPRFEDLSAEDLSEPQAIQLKYCDWVCFMIRNPPMYQNKPVDPDTTKNHENLQGSIGWHSSYKDERVKAG